MHDLRDADAECGGKARSLGRLVAGGLPVPAGFVIDARAFRQIVGDLATTDRDTLGHTFDEAATRIEHAEIPAELEREVRERLKDLGSLVAVRSSASIEDGEAGAGAGVFSSRRAVPVAEVWSAIRAVWISALTPLAAAYARRRDAAIAIGVIVQEWVDGTPLTIYTRPPGEPESVELLLQRGDHLSRFSREDLPREIEAEHACLLALRAEREIDASRGADVELVQIRKQYGYEVVIQTWVVQARPIVHPPARSLVAPPPLVLAPLDDGRVWTWDVAHNPDPLSIAQTGLVERVERAAISPWSLRVCAGYLYTSPRPDAPKPPPVATAEAFAARTAVLEAELVAILDGPPPSTVNSALERYLAFYAVWAGQLAPLIAVAREHARAAGATVAVGSRPSSVESILKAAARGELSEAEVERQLGALAPGWDVAIPTFGERPGLLREAIRGVTQPMAGHAAPEIARIRATRGVTQPIAGHDATLARLAADLAERDDVLFARAQLLVRRALLARAAELGLDGDDIFWLPLDDVSTAESVNRDAAHRRASAARSAAARAAQWQMPVSVGAPPNLGRSLHGLGTGPRVTGRVVRFGSLATAAFVGASDIVVVRAVTPALAVFIGRCAAIVSESGGLLDHGAALARELGIPCVVGCHDAWVKLAAGMLVTVDGDAGTVTPIGTQSSS